MTFLKLWLVGIGLFAAMFVFLLCLGAIVCAAGKAFGQTGALIAMVVLGIGLVAAVVAQCMGEAKP